MSLAECGGSAMGGVDVEPDFVAVTDCGDVGEHVECADRRGARGRADGDNRHALRPQFSRLLVEPVGVHAASPVESRGMNVVGAEAEDAGRAGDAVVDVGMGDDHGCRLAAAEARRPGIAEHDVAGSEQRREIGERTARGDEAGKRAGREAELLANRGDHGVFDGRGKGPHFIDRHHLVGDGAHQIEQRGERHGRRDLVTDVVGWCRFWPRRSTGG